MLLVACMLFALLYGCGKKPTGAIGITEKPTAAAASPPALTPKPLRAAIVAGPATYLPAIANSNNDGFEVTLLRDVAQLIGRPLELLEVSSQANAKASLRSGATDIAVAHFSATYFPMRGITWSTPLLSRPVAVLHNPKKTHAPRSALDLLPGGFELTSDARHGELARAMLHKFPELHWQQPNGVSIEKMMQRISSGSSEFTLADSHHLTLFQPRYPNTALAYELPDRGRGHHWRLVWALPEPSISSNQSINEAIQQLKHSGVIDQRYEEYFAHLRRLDPGTVQSFRTLQTTRLPTYQALFEQAGLDYDFDWRLLAAIGFQESRWNPIARSHTGVRGLMMITKGTAGELGITNRLDPTQSINGGAKFLRSLNRRLDPTIEEPDRTWLALAAYNVGLGHVHDARALAREAGDNPNHWQQLRKHLPKLAQKPQCQQLRYGCARGQEPVDYVAYIRAFEEMLLQSHPATTITQRARISVKVGVPLPPDRQTKAISVSAGVRSP